jgi:hypothetical protein
MYIEDTYGALLFCNNIDIYIYKYIYIYLFIREAMPVKAWTVPEGSRSLRLPDFKTIGT